MATNSSSSGLTSCAAGSSNPSDRWYFTKEQLEQTPSRKHGYDHIKELSYRQQTANFIQDMGQRLKVSQLCINTAIVYMHRFYVFHSFTDFPWHQMAAAALFLAAKVEEQPRKLEYVIRVANMCRYNRDVNIDVNSEKYIAQSQDLVFNENVLLQTLGFDVAIDHPHTHVVRCCHLVRASKDLAQSSYFLASNSLHLTTMCLQYKPTVVACFCIHLACKWSSWEIPLSSERKEWFLYVDPTVTSDLLRQLTDEFLSIFESCPSRLKEKIMSIGDSSVFNTPSTMINSPFDLPPDGGGKKPSTSVPIAGTSSSATDGKDSHGHRSAVGESDAHKHKPPQLVPIQREQRERDYQRDKKLAQHMKGGLPPPPLPPPPNAAKSSGSHHHHPHHSHYRPMGAAAAVSASGDSQKPSKPAATSRPISCAPSRPEPIDILREAGTRDISFGIAVARDPETATGSSNKSASGSKHLTELPLMSHRGSSIADHKRLVHSPITAVAAAAAAVANPQRSISPFIGDCSTAGASVLPMKSVQPHHHHHHHTQHAQHPNSLSVQQQQQLMVGFAAAAGTSRKPALHPTVEHTMNTEGVVQQQQQQQQQQQLNRSMDSAYSSSGCSGGGSGLSSLFHAAGQSAIQLNSEESGGMSPNRQKSTKSLNRLQATSLGCSKQSLLPSPPPPPLLPPSSSMLLMNTECSKQPQPASVMRKLEPIEGFENLLHEATRHIQVPDIITPIADGEPKLLPTSYAKSTKPPDIILPIGGNARHHHQHHHHQHHHQQQQQPPPPPQTVVNGMETNPLLISSLLKEAPTLSHLPVVAGDQKTPFVPLMAATAALVPPPATATNPSATTTSTTAVGGEAVQHTKEHHHHKSKKKNKDKHKHKDKDKHREDKEKKKKHKDKEKRKHKTQTNNSSNDGGGGVVARPVISEPIKIKIQKDKIQPLTSDSAGCGLKIKISKKDVISGGGGGGGGGAPTTSSGSEQSKLQSSAVTTTPRLKIKIPKERLSGCSAAAVDGCDKPASSSTARKRDRNAVRGSDEMASAAKQSRVSHGKTSKANGKHSYPTATKVSPPCSDTVCSRTSSSSSSRICSGSTMVPLQRRQQPPAATLGALPPPKTVSVPPVVVRPPPPPQASAMYPPMPPPQNLYYYHHPATHGMHIAPPTLSSMAPPPTYTLYNTGLPPPSVFHPSYYPTNYLYPPEFYHTSNNPPLPTEAPPPPPPPPPE